MLLQPNFNNFNRRTVKFLTINVIGMVGLVSAVMAIIYSQDQAGLLTQLGSELAQSPMGMIVSSIKWLF